MDAAQAVVIGVSIFAIVNPVGVIPTFVALTSDMPQASKKHVVLKATLVAAGVFFLFGLAGPYIFKVFGITIPAFRIAGGILIFKVAFDMLHGERPRSDSNDREIEDALERESIGITPLGIPLLTGPGAISTIMILVQTYPSTVDRSVIFAVSALTFVITFVLLASADKLFGRLGRSGLMVFTRVMGLILAAIAVTFVVSGLKAIAPTMFTGA